LSAFVALASAATAKDARPATTNRAITFFIIYVPFPMKYVPLQY
jgi:hypothetical protein